MLTAHLLRALANGDSPSLLFSHTTGGLDIGQFSDPTRLCCICEKPGQIYF
jgi:hypothetical protein